MTGRLALLRSRLARLRRVRSALRGLAAWSALASGVVIALLVIFGLDLVFDLGVQQRVVVLTLALAAIGWSYWRFTRPLLRPAESELEVALVVERQQQIDSDLVAALQFERPEAAAWGSPQLTTAVVDYVAAAGPGINVFEGLSVRQAVERGAVLSASLAVLITAAVLWPAHLVVFANRLAFGSMHYPTRTRIEAIIVNDAAVLAESDRGAAPADAKAPQGRPLSFLVACSGQLPSGGAVVLTAANAAHERTRMALVPLSLDQRRERLRDASARLNDAMQSASSEILPSWRNQVLTLVRFDAPEAIAPLLAAKRPTDLSPVVAAVTRANERWHNERHATALLAGELPRLNDDLTYKVLAGDASSDSAHVQMIPLPTVELALSPIPPKYAAAAAPKNDASGRQLAVIEGSSISLRLTCTNHKRLSSAWLTLYRAGTSQRVDLAPLGGEQAAWGLKEQGSPLASVHEELRYEAQVIDADGLSLETPLRGTIRIRPDLPPTGIAEVVHRVVLPTAAPVIAYRATDDYGIAGLAVVVDVERGAAKPAPATAAEDYGSLESKDQPPAAAAPSESRRFPIPLAQSPIVADRLPLAGNYSLALAPLALVKGDRIKLTLEVTDYRGENGDGRPAGKSQAGEAVVLEISDESGVLAAISQPDQRSADQLSEIIKRQLGIGEQP